MNKVVEFLNHLLINEGTSSLVIRVFSVVFITLLIDFFQKKFFKRIHIKVTATTQLWDDAIHYAVNPPLSLFIWLIGLSLAAEMVGKHSDAVIFTMIASVRNIGIIIVFTWFVLRLINAFEQNLLIKASSAPEEVDVQAVDAISKLLRLSVIITAILMGLQTLGISISGLLAFGGMGGIAVGFAAKDLLANFFGGLMIYFDRPFAVGDWVRSPDRNIEGTVESIGWRLSVIRTFDKRPLYVPNSTFASIAVENPSRMSHRRIHETIGIRYQDAAKLAAIVKDVQNMLSNHADIDSSQTLIVNFNTFASSSLEFFIYTFTRTTKWVEYHRVKQDVLLKIISIVEGHDAQFAFPTSTVHLHQDDEHPHLQD
jgi:MscS family membrane protein